jgi:hypothetical protein
MRQETVGLRTLKNNEKLTLLPLFENQRLRPSKFHAQRTVRLNDPRQHDYRHRPLCAQLIRSAIRRWLRYSQYTLDKRIYCVST